MSHLASINANKKSFASTGQEYDAKPSIQTLTDYFAASILRLDVSAERKTFDETEKPLSAQEASGLLTSIPPDFERHLIWPNSKVIDFACGTGLLAKKLAPFMPQGEIVGIDISETMLSGFDAKAEQIKQEFPALKIRSICGDVLDQSFDTTALEKYADVVICTLAFHHIHSYEKVAHILKAFVRPGGHILVYDFYNEDSDRPVSPELAKRGVSRHGLSIDEMSRCFGDCRNVSTAREVKIQLWQEEQFILSHCRQAVIDNLPNVPKKDNLYYVESSVILAVVQV